MRAILAVADLRFRECVAGRLLWLLPLVFAAALATPLWIEGAEAADRVARADRALLTLATGLALLAAVVPPALGLPKDVRRGSAHALLATPASRFSVQLGALLGYGWFASILLAGMVGASLIGLELVGLGAAARTPVRRFESLVPAGEEPGKTVVLSRERPDAVFPFVVPDGVDGESSLRVRIRPRSRHQAGGYPLTDACTLGIGRPGEAGADARVEFGMSVPFTADVPLNDLEPGAPAELRISGGAHEWQLVLEPGAVQLGGAPRLFTLEVLAAAVCLAPLLFLLAAASLCGAARFGAPTAVALALAVAALFASQDILADSARYVVEAAEIAASGADGDEHGHAGHDHGPSDVSGLELALAHGTLGVLGVLPPLEVFDRTGPLVERRGTTPAEMGRAWTLAAPGLLLLALVGWLLLRGRELVPR